jgi:hypothetical protein
VAATLPSSRLADTLDFFFADNATTPVVSLNTALTSQSYLLQYMFRRNSSTVAAAPYARQLSEWPYAGANETTANITAEAYMFGPMDSGFQRRCAYINELLMDEKNGV